MVMNTMGGGYKYTSDTVKAKILEQHFAHSESDIRHQKRTVTARSATHTYRVPGDGQVAGGAGADLNGKGLGKYGEMKGVGKASKEQAQAYGGNYYGYGQMPGDYYGKGGGMSPSDYYGKEYAEQWDEYAGYDFDASSNSKGKGKQGSALNYSAKGYSSKDAAAASEAAYHAAIDEHIKATLDEVSHLSNANAFTYPYGKGSKETGSAPLSRIGSNQAALPTEYSVWNSDWWHRHDPAWAAPGKGKGVGKESEERTDSGKGTDLYSPTTQANAPGDAWHTPTEGAPAQLQPSHTWHPVGPFRDAAPFGRSLAAFIAAEKAAAISASVRTHKSTPVSSTGPLNSTRDALSVDGGIRRLTELASQKTYAGTWSSSAKSSREQDGAGTTTAPTGSAAESYISPRSPQPLVGGNANSVDRIPTPPSTASSDDTDSEWKEQRRIERAAATAASNRTLAARIRYVLQLVRDSAGRAASRETEVMVGASGSAVLRVFGDVVMDRAKDLEFALGDAQCDGMFEGFWRTLKAHKKNVTDPE
jgi:hypothetical protein